MKNLLFLSTVILFQMSNLAYANASSCTNTQKEAAISSAISIIKNMHSGPNARVSEVRGGLFGEIPVVMHRLEYNDPNVPNSKIDSDLLQEVELDDATCEFIGTGTGRTLELAR